MDRVRKELILYLGDMPEDTELRNGVTNRDVLVWLEEQGEKKPVCENAEKEETKNVLGLTTRELLGLKNNLMLPVFTDKDVAALDCCKVLAWQIRHDEALYEQLCSLHRRIRDIISNTTSPSPGRPDSKINNFKGNGEDSDNR